MAQISKARLAQTELMIRITKLKHKRAQQAARPRKFIYVTNSLARIVAWVYSLRALAVLDVIFGLILGTVNSVVDN